MAKMLLLLVRTTRWTPSGPVIGAQEIERRLLVATEPCCRRDSSGATSMTALLVKLGGARPVLRAIALGGVTIGSWVGHSHDAEIVREMQPWQPQGNGCWKVSRKGDNGVG